jgi:hypothetical protein
MSFVEGQAAPSRQVSPIGPSMFDRSYAAFWLVSLSRSSVAR